MGERSSSPCDLKTRFEIPSEVHRLKTRDVIVILDCGSQYTQLIARRIRELRVFSEILPWDAPVEEIRSRSPKGIVISGSPMSVRFLGLPRCLLTFWRSAFPSWASAMGCSCCLSFWAARWRGQRQRNTGALKLRSKTKALRYFAISPDAFACG